MAERRRRRKLINNDISDEGSEDSADEQLEKAASDNVSLFCLDC